MEILGIICLLGLIALPNTYLWASYADNRWSKSKIEDSFPMVVATLAIIVLLLIMWLQDYT